MEKVIYHESSRIKGGSCGFGSWPCEEEEQGLVQAGFILETEDEDEFIPETGETITHRVWVAIKP